jgi:hypothetical protein
MERLIGLPQVSAPQTVSTEAQMAELRTRQDDLARDLERITDARLEALRAEARVLGRQKPR